MKVKGRCIAVMYRMNEYYKEGERIKGKIIFKKKKKEHNDRMDENYKGG